MPPTAQPTPVLEFITAMEEYTVEHITSAYTSFSEPESAPLLVAIGSCEGEKLKILIDCGASRDFINASSLKRLKVPTHTLQHPLRVKLADGSISTTN